MSEGYNDSKAKPVWSKLSPDVHTALHVLATSMGISSSELISELVEEALAKRGEDKDAPIDLQIFREVARVRRVTVIDKALSHLALDYVNAASEEKLEQLALFCAQKGVVLEKLLLDVPRNGEGATLYREASAQMIPVLNWVKKFLTGKTRIATKAVEAAAAAENIPLYLLKEVKAKLEIPSRRDGGLPYYWFPMESAACQNFINGTWKIEAYSRSGGGE